MEPRLKKAAELITEVVAGLERETTICECCGATRWKNRNHYQMGIELDAVVKKLERWGSGLSQRS